MVFSGSQVMFVGLMVDPVSLEYKWFDGTPYDLTISPPFYQNGVQGNNFVIWDSKFDDWNEIYGAGYMCQANLDGKDNYWKQGAKYTWFGKYSVGWTVKEEFTSDAKQN